MPTADCRSFLLAKFSAVFGKDEIINIEAENWLATAGLYQRRYQHNIGVAMEEWSGTGGLLCMRVSAGENSKDQQNTQADLYLSRLIYRVRFEEMTEKELQLQQLRAFTVRLVPLGHLACLPYQILVKPCDCPLDGIDLVLSLLEAVTFIRIIVDVDHAAFFS